MVEEIYKEFEKKRAEILREPEVKEKLPPEKEKEILKEAVYERIQTAQPIPPAQQKVIIQKAQEIKAQPKERQIQLLTELAFEKSVIEAVEIAKQLDSPYLLDEFHDILVDKLYDKLVEEGKLEKI
ncbi:MAG: hypothetical protein ACOZAL_01650 [Patescibacteria group bacterium]